MTPARKARTIKKARARTAVKSNKFSKAAQLRRISAAQKEMRATLNRAKRTHKSSLARWAISKAKSIQNMKFKYERKAVRIRSFMTVKNIRKKMEQAYVKLMVRAEERRLAANETSMAAEQAKIARTEKKAQLQAIRNQYRRRGINGLLDRIPTKLKAAGLAAAFAATPAVAQFVNMVGTSSAKQASSETRAMSAEQTNSAESVRHIRSVDVPQTASNDGLVSFNGPSVDNNGTNGNGDAINTDVIQDPSKFKSGWNLKGSMLARVQGSVTHKTEESLGQEKKSGTTGLLRADVVGQGSVYYHKGDWSFGGSATAWFRQIISEDRNYSDVNLAQFKVGAIYQISPNQKVEVSASRDNWMRTSQFAEHDSISRAMPNTLSAPYTGLNAAYQYKNATIRAGVVYDQTDNLGWDLTDLSNPRSAFALNVKLPARFETEIAAFGLESDKTEIYAGLYKRFDKAFVGLSGMYQERLDSNGHDMERYLVKLSGEKRFNKNWKAYGNVSYGESSDYRWETTSWGASAGVQYRFNRNVSVSAGVDYEVQDSDYKQYKVKNGIPTGEVRKIQGAKKVDALTFTLQGNVRF